MTSCIVAQEPAESAVHAIEEARGNGSGKGVEIFLVYGRDLGGVSPVDATSSTASRHFALNSPAGMIRGIDHLLHDRPTVDGDDKNACAASAKRRDLGGPALVTTCPRPPAVYRM